MGWFSIFKKQNPAKSPFSLGQVVLKELADCKNELAEVKRQFAERPVQTHFAEDHEEIKKLISSAENHNKRFDLIWEKLGQIDEKISNLAKYDDNLAGQILRLKEDVRWNSINIEGLNNRLKELENKSISTRIRSVLAHKSWERPRRKDGRWIKKNGAGNAKSA